MPPSTPLPQSMLAWQYHPSFTSSANFANLKLNQTAPVPKLKASQTLVKVLSAGLNPVDYKLGELAFVGRLAMGATATPAVDYVGRVWETTVPSASFAPGDLVFGQLPVPGSQGTLAQYVVVDGTDGIVKVPSGVDLDGLGGVGVCGFTAYQSIVPYLETNGPGSAQGKSIFINGGSGGVGTFAVQIAKAIGCSNVVSSCSGANAELVRGLGADHVVDYRNVNVVDGVNSWVKERNGGQKFDLVIDLAGADLNLYWKAHQYLKEGASYVFVGAGISIKTFLEVGQVMVLPGFLGGGKRKFDMMGAAVKGKDLEALAKLMQEGKVKPVIDSTFTMDQATDAYKRLKTGRARGKVIVRVSEDGRN